MIADKAELRAATLAAIDEAIQAIKGDPFNDEEPLADDMIQLAGEQAGLERARRLVEICFGPGAVAPADQEGVAT